MKLLSLILNAGGLAQGAMGAISNATDSSRTPWSSTFQQPEPPLVKAEFKASWNQHKWDANVSHIASGFIYNSPKWKKVRVDETYDSALGSSLFDYSNVTEEGVFNRQWILSPSIKSAPDCFKGHVDPSFPLIPEDILVSSQAIFGGSTQDQFAGQVDVWSFLYQGRIPVTILLDKDNIVQGYDFLGVETRARAITRFFNIIVGPIGEEIFDFPC